MTPQEAAKYINSARNPQERQFRKMECYAFMYSSGPKPFIELYAKQNNQPKPKEIK